MTIEILVGSTMISKTFGTGRIIRSVGVWGEDKTDCHIDGIARVAGPGLVLINFHDVLNLEDPFHVAAADTYDNSIAERLDVEVIPEPVRLRVDNVGFVAAYANYNVCNGDVIASEFDDRKTDQIAKNTLARRYPERELITLNVDPLGEMGGGFHCATQQKPTT